jgi:hypothetical protein
VIDSRTENIMREVARRELRSLLQYLAESFPWATPDKAPIAGALRQMAAQSRDVVGKITRFLRRHHAGFPCLGAFPMDFTNINFIGLDYALARLVKDETRMLADLGMYQLDVADGEAKALIADLIAVKQAHLKELESFAGQVPATTLR